MGLSDSRAPLEVARSEVSLGLPVSRGQRGRFLKRLVTKACWPFLRHQLVVNATLVDSLDSVTENVSILTTEASRQATDTIALTARVLSTERSAEAVLATSARLEAVEHALGSLGRTIEGVVARLDSESAGRIAADETLANHYRTLEHHHETMVRHDLALEAHERTFDDHRQEFSRIAERIEIAAMQAFSRHHDGIASIQSQLADIAAYVDDSLSQIGSELTDTIERRIGELGTELEVVRQASGAQFDNLRTTTTRQLAQLERSMRDLRIRLASVDLTIDAFSHPGDHQPREVAPAALSTFGRIYDNFVEATAPGAGWRSLQADRLLDELHDLPDDGQVLDIGCGDGWWLARLSEAGIPAYGIETRPRLAQRAGARGMNVQQEWPHEHLASLAKGSLGAITMIDFIEYLTTDELVRLLDLSLLALAPGGLLIIETLDPANLVVASSVFPEDPERKWLVPRELLAYLIEARGFATPRSRPGVQPPGMLTVPNPERVPWAADVAPVVQLINERLLGPVTYVLVAQR